MFLYLFTNLVHIKLLMKSHMKQKYAKQTIIKKIVIYSVLLFGW